MVQGFGGEKSLLRQAQEMHRRMQEVEAELRERFVEGSVSGGLVKCTINGQLEVQSVRIAAEVIDPSDVDGLEALVTIAVREAVEAARELRKREIDKVTGGIEMPGFGF